MLNFQKIYFLKMLGIIAAQSIGETFTQSTLNTFHKAGLLNSKKGISRVEELLNVSKTPKSIFYRLKSQLNVFNDVGSVVVVDDDEITIEAQKKNFLKLLGLAGSVYSSNVCMGYLRNIRNIEAARELISFP